MKALARRRVLCLPRASIRSTSKRQNISDSILSLKPSHHSNFNLSRLRFRLSVHSPYVGVASPHFEVCQVHVVSSCHLDVGFADSASGILNRYFDHYFTKAAAIADELRAGSERMIFMTFPSAPLGSLDGIDNFEFGISFSDSLRLH